MEELDDVLGECVVDGEIGLLWCHVRVCGALCSGTIAVLAHVAGKLPESVSWVSLPLQDCAVLMGDGNLPSIKDGCAAGVTQFSDGN